MNPHLQGILLPLTNRQKEVLAFMWAYFKENDTLPSTAEICRHFAITNQAVQDFRAALAKKGYIEKNAVSKYRFTPMFHKEQAEAA